MKKVNILIVDDSNMEQNLIKVLCFEELWGKFDEATILREEALNADVALQKIITGAFDIIVLDGNMPKIDGPEIIPDIQKFSPDSTIIMHTNDERHKATAQGLGVELMTDKNTEVLMRTLEELCTNLLKEIA